MSTTPEENSEENKDQPQGNPHIQAALEGIPEEFVGILKPRLEEWDSKSAEKVRQVQSEWKDWQEFKEQGIDPQLARNALMFGQQLEENPQEMLNKIIQHFDLDPKTLFPDQGQNSDKQDDEDIDLGDLDEDSPLAKRVLQLLESQKAIEAQLESQQQGQVNKEAEEALDAYLDELREEFKEQGDFDENYVLTLMGAGVQGDEAVKSFFKLGETYFSPNGQSEDETDTNTSDAPVVSGASGNMGSGLPSNVNPPKNLDRPKVNDLVVQMLEKAGKPEGES